MTTPLRSTVFGVLQELHPQGYPQILWITPGVSGSFDAQVRQISGNKLPTSEGRDTNRRSLRLQQGFQLSGVRCEKATANVLPSANSSSLPTGTPRAICMTCTPYRAAMSPM